MAGLDYCSCGICGRRLFYDGDRMARDCMADCETVKFLVCDHCYKKKLKRISKLEKHRKRGK